MIPTEFSKILLERYQAGDSQAATEIYARYAQRLLGLAQTKLLALLRAKIDPDDIAQETFLAFFELADRGKVRWDREGDLWRLLAGIAIKQMHRKSEFFTAAKRNVGREVTQSGVPVVDTKRDNADAVCQIEDLVTAVLQNEKPLTKRVLSSRLAGMTLEEIALRTGRSERTIRRVLQTIKSKFADIYDFHFENDLESKPPTSAGNQPIDRSSFDDFDLVRMIGVGGFGKVYEARNNRTGEQVAIKVLKRSWLGQAEIESQFLNEANQLAKLDHPNIVGFHGIGPLPNGGWFIVMEKCVGCPLSSFDFTNANPRDTLERVREIATAISYLHGKSVVHGDLQPANIMLTQTGAKLIDFGFSCLQKIDSPKRKRFVGGADGYVAPELTTSFESDVFSLGKTIEFVLNRLNNVPNCKIQTGLRKLVRIACDIQPNNRPSANLLAERVCDAMST